jgi:hypothetical protein
VKPISLRSNDTKEIELALNRLIRELDRSGNGSTLPSSIAYADEPPVNLRGETGEKGEKGDKGDIGPQGVKGDIGPSGADGLNGDSPVRTFETISQNHTNGTPTATITAGLVTSIAYDFGGGTIITKTFARNGNGQITTITLSGSVPVGIPTVKTMSYDGNGNWTGATYA